jgi:prephenate dehydrogenase (NADP+)
MRPRRLIDVASRVNACDIPDKYDALKLEYTDKVLHVADQSRLGLKRV